MTALLRTRIRSRRQTLLSFLASLAAVLERSADDSATFCACADGNRCVA